MAFDDSPKVDKNSERSEKSVTSSLEIFSRMNGFVSHNIDGTDDYGVDLNVQLVVERNVTAYYFPIQIKSERTYKEVANGFGSFKYTSFKTSRLGHLVRHNPTSGIIVIYDESTNELFYDFSFEIYNRIRLTKESDSWKKQDTVTIQIPVKNRLYQDSIPVLHARILNYFQNHDKLLNEQGKNYGLPVPIDKPLNNKSPLEILEEYGGLMFNMHKFPELVFFLEEVDKKYLKRKRIAYLGAIVYSEVGELIDANYFFELCSQSKFDFSKEEIEVLDFQKFKYQFYTGILSRAQLIKLLSSLKGQTSTVENALYLDINLLNLELMDLVGEKKFDENIFKRIDKLFSEIEDRVENEETRFFQKVFLADILEKSLSRVLMDAFIETRIYEAYNKNPATPERVAKSKELVTINNKCNNIMHESISYAEKNNNQLLLAHSLFNLAILRFNQCYAFFFARHEIEDIEKTQLLLSSTLECALKSYTEFSNLALAPYAYKAICLSSEIHKLANHWASYNLDSLAKIDKIIEVIKRFEEKGFASEHESIVDNTALKMNHLFNQNVHETFSDLKDDDVENLARIHLKMMGYSEDRYDNLVQEVKSHQIFNEYCLNKDLLLLTDQSYKGKHAYSEPSKYAVVSKKTGNLFVEGYDINDILKRLGYDGF